MRALIFLFFILFFGKHGARCVYDHEQFTAHLCVLWAASRKPVVVESNVHKLVPAANENKASVATVARQWPDTLGWVSFATWTTELSSL